MRKINRFFKTMYKYFKLTWTFLYSMKTLIVLLIIIALKYRFNILLTITQWKIENYKLLLEYFSVILSFPTIVLILGLIFLYRFSDSIKRFFETVRSFKAGPLEFGTQQQQEENNFDQSKKALKLNQKGITLKPSQVKKIEKNLIKISEEKAQKDLEIKNKDEVIKYLIGRAEFFEFLYLNRYLVLSTKTALFWLYMNPTFKEDFMNKFSISPQILNPIAEKEAILNSLFVSKLLDSNDGIIFVTEKGKRFLRYLGYNIK